MSFDLTTFRISLSIHKLQVIPSVLHLGGMRKGLGSYPDDGYAPQTSSNESETRVRSFPNASLTGIPEICALEMKFEGQLVKQKYQSRILPQLVLRYTDGAAYQINLLVAMISTHNSVEN